MAFIFIKISISSREVIIKKTHQRCQHGIHGLVSMLLGLRLGLCCMHAPIHNLLHHTWVSSRRCTSTPSSRPGTPERGAGGDAVERLREGRRSAGGRGRGWRPRTCIEFFQSVVTRSTSHELIAGFTSKGIAQLAE